MQGGTATGVSLAGDKALEPLGSEQGYDGAKAGTMAMLGPLGEFGAAGAKALWTKFITIPKYFDKSTMQLTPLGKQAAQKMGLDPDQMASDAMSTFGKTYAMNPADAKTAVDAGNFDFNIPATRGQLGKDPQQLLQEKAMRSGLYGLEAKAQIEDLDRRQAEAVATAVTDTIPSRMAGRPWRGGNNPEVYGNNIGGNLRDAQKNAKTAERSAWIDTGPITPTTVTTDVADAMTPVTGVSKPVQSMGGADMLKAEMSANLEPLSGVLSPENTPAAFGMWKYLNDFMAGRKPATAMHDSLGLSGARDLDSVRRGLGMLSADAKTQTDKTAARAIYKAYNDWIEKAADAQLLSGDTVVAAKLKAARDVSAQMNGIFKPMKDGKLTPGGRILERIAGSADTPERIVDALIPAPNSAIPDGTIEALGHIRRAMQKYGNPGAEEQVWNSVKVAWLSKLTQGRNGEFLSPHVMSQNLRKAMSGQASLFNTVFAPSDKAVLGRFLTQLDRINWKDPNPSGTATSLAGLGKQLFGKILDAFGPVGRAAWDYSGVQHAWGSSIARQAVKQEARVAPSVTRNAATRYGNALVAPIAINNALSALPQRPNTGPDYGHVPDRYMGN
jgi:hypothetical protein